MLGFQAAGAAPIVDGAPVHAPHTIATAIKIGNPASWQGAVAARDNSQGIIEKVTDEEILEAYQMVASLEGVFAEPASVAPLAGIKKMAKMGYFAEPAVITVTLTGHGLKDPERSIKTVPKPQVVQANRDAILKIIGL